MTASKDPNTSNSKDYLASFLGPKAENRTTFEQLILMILRDYVHWRSNYYPEDKLLVTPRMERELQSSTDTLIEQVYLMMAQLRRNFPFYSPRYLAHMLSDPTIPSMIGYFAGMLFNPNNVTTEAAPVTVEWELDVCNEAMEMLGFIPPPKIELEETPDEYLNRLPPRFGWAHLTFDGTTATIEAMWVARTVRYLPLAIWDVSKRRNLELSVRLLNNIVTRVNEIEDPYALLLIPPSHALLLLDAYLLAFEKHLIDIGDPQAGKKVNPEAWSELRKSQWDLVSQGCAKMFTDYPPEIYCTGAAHYSVRKAADLLGIGSARVKPVAMSSQFRMDPQSLYDAICEAVTKRRVPLFVVGIAATTEEGAVDPIHDLCQVRSQLEREQKASFWLHIDAAWGGYIRSILNPSDDDKWQSALFHISEKLGAKVSRDNPKWLDEVVKHMGGREQAKEVLRSAYKVAFDINKRIKEKSFDGIAGEIKRLVKELEGAFEVDNSVFALTHDDIVELVKKHVVGKFSLSWEGQTEDIEVSWNDPDVLKAFQSFGQADSIVCDPHKMGYTVYPAGLIAFQDNRVRQTIRQEAPYITALGDKNVAYSKRHLNVPTRYKDEKKDPTTNRYPVVVEALARFILEGSRPGAAATSLWLSHKSLPPKLHGHGQVVRSSLLAARALYECLSHSATMFERSGQHFVRFVPLCIPDTNVVTFVVVPLSYRKLRSLNMLTKAVYEKFSIQSELGDGRYSYSQPFFLSHNKMSAPHYDYDVMKPLFNKCQIVNHSNGGYLQHGVEVLRAAVMTPYLWPMESDGKQSMLAEFLVALLRVANEACTDLVNRKEFL
jgi:glutamate/tyrosine decarboxylase-like PLP-dependent enzyme